MSEKITSLNLDEVIKTNTLIHNEIEEDIRSFRSRWNRMQLRSLEKLAMEILKKYGLIQIPLDNQYWSGAIFVKSGKRIPVINTALPRGNQYFTRWHEIYHLIFDTVSFSHVIGTEIVLEERKADYFASCMLLEDLLPYYESLPEMDFLTKIFYSMDAFSAPYNAVLISLYDGACKNGDESLMESVREVFDNSFTNLPLRFRKLGLDDSLVSPSYVINASFLESEIAGRIKSAPDIKYNYENENFLKKVLSETFLLAEEDMIG